MAKNEISKDRTYLKPSEIIDTLVEVFVHNYNLRLTGASDARFIVPILWGSPGIGKTRCVYTAVAMASTRLGVELPVLMEPIADKSPEEITGYPRPDSDFTFRRLAPHRWYDKHTSPMVGFFDEVAQGNTEQQNVARGAMLGQTIGEIKLAPGSSIVCASNLMEDRAGTHVMPTHVRDVLMHLYMRADHKEWSFWGIENGISPEITSFIHVHGAQWLHDLDASSTAMACPSPRSYEKADSIFRMDIAEHLKKAMIAGTIGQPACGALYDHIKLGKYMPDTDAILAGKTVKFTEDRSDVMYMTMCKLATDVTKDTTAGLVKFIESMRNKEFGSFCINMSLRRDKTLRNTSAVSRWMINNEATLIL